MRKVVAYGDLESLVSSEFYEIIKGDVHIAETSSMKDMLKRNKLFDKVCLFGEIVKEIVPGWSREGQRMRCLALISKCLRI